MRSSTLSSLFDVIRCRVYYIDTLSCLVLATIHDKIADVRDDSSASETSCPSRPLDRGYKTLHELACDSKTLHDLACDDTEQCRVHFWRPEDVSQDHSRTFQTPRWGHQGPISKPKHDLAAFIPLSLRLNAHDLPEQHHRIHRMTCVHRDTDAVKRLSGGLKTRPRPPKRPSEDDGRPQLQRQSDSGPNTKNNNFT